ncbi:protein NUCLEAR FUSION DEFECTIVE 6, mitochondrial [Rosa sericea]
MAANCARRTLQFSSASAKALFNSSSSSPFASKAFKLSELAGAKTTSTSRFAATQKLKFSRLPVELAAAQSLIPLHSATASALFTSLLSLHNASWGCLSEGFATPL